MKLYRVRRTDAEPQQAGFEGVMSALVIAASEDAARIIAGPYCNSDRVVTMDVEYIGTARAGLGVGLVDIHTVLGS